MRSIYAILAALIFFITVIPYTTSAQELLTSTSSRNFPTDYDELEPTTFSFSDIAPAQTSGEVDASRANISWTSGTRPDRLFTIGMFQRSFGFQNLSLNQIDALTGKSYADAPLSSFNLVQNLTVSDLISALPRLRQLPVSMSPPIQALAQKLGIDTVGGSILIEAIAPLIAEPISYLGSDLANYAISQIPGLRALALQQFPGWADSLIAEVPGLSSTPLINLLLLKDYFIPFDIPFGMSPCNISQECQEFNIDNTASGNWKNTSIPCIRGTCSHIEVKRTGNDTNKIRWVSKEQKVPGGNGFLCTEEPTGRFPFGKNPKVVLEEIREDPGEIEFALYFSIDGPFGAESAHCFGPFPMPFWGKRKEEQLILFGLDKPSKKTPLSDIITMQPQNPRSNSQPVTKPQDLALAEDCKNSTSTFVRPTSDPVTDEFGYRAWRGRNHAGLDLGSPYGTPIVAANCGIVSYSGWFGGYGNFMLVKHPGGGETAYAHMAEPSTFSVGAQVKRGEQIGRVGSTGHSTGPHLHFEWHPFGWRNPANPRQLGVF